MSIISNLILRWKQFSCEHYWRPAIQTIRSESLIVSGDIPCRICDYCGKRDLLNEAEFYAQFGRMPRV